MLVRGIALGVLSCFRVFAQNGHPIPTFDVASIKSVDPANIRPVMGPLRRGGPGTADPSRIIWNMQTLTELIATAWSVDWRQIAGPPWLAPQGGGGVYDLTATMPPTTSLQDFRLMLQNLLIDRFKIEFHHEMRLYPGYNLVVAKSGPKLKPAKDPNAPYAFEHPGKLDPDGFPLIPDGRGYDAARSGNLLFMRFQGLSIPEFIDSTFNYWVRQALDIGPVRIEDKTGLQGRFDFTLNFTADPPSNVTIGPAVQSRIQDSENPTPGGGAAIDGIFKAVEKQLGLQLVRKANGFALDTIIIDHCERRPVE